MTDTYKVLGQAKTTGSNTVGVAYTVPSATQTAMSNTTIVNTGVATASYSLFAIPASEYSSIEVVTTTPGESYNIGDIGPAGGYIFITPSTSGNTTGKYFEVAPQSSEVQRQFSEDAFVSTAVSGADSASIGAGEQNTLDIIAQGNTDPNICAAAYASQYTYGGYSDWFIPSSDEMQQIAINKTLLGNDFQPVPVMPPFTAYYGTSTEDVNYFARQISIADGSNGGTAKNALSWVRPVRSFTPASGETTTTLTPLSKHAIIKSRTIESGQHHIITGGIMLNSGDKVLLSADTSDVVVSMFGTEIS